MEYFTNNLTQGSVKPFVLLKAFTCCTLHVVWPNVFLSPVCWQQLVHQAACWALWLVSRPIRPIAAHAPTWLPPGSLLRQQSTAKWKRHKIGWKSRLLYMGLNQSQLHIHRILLEEEQKSTAKPQTQSLSEHRVYRSIHYTLQWFQEYLT